MINKIWQNIDSKPNKDKTFFLFLLIWMLVNIGQAYFTVLAHDEAYYWMYSKYLDWGYFDHPPMIAILVKIGYAVFPNELGVRLLPTLMGGGTLYFIYLLMKNELKNISMFIILLCTIVIVQTHIGGFLAIPDLPLIFFGALFFLLYKNYLIIDKWYYSVFLGAVAVAMMYSKYHTVLVLFFTLVSNPKILKRWSFWLIPIIVAISMTPHLLWQINNDFPTFGYHLSGRTKSYSFLETLNYIAGQFLILGPFVSVIVFYHALKARTDGDEFLKALKYNFVGFFVFFFFSSFRGHVEAHWTALAIIPLIVLSYKSIIKSQKATIWMKRLFLPSVIAFLVVRVIIILGATPKSMYFGREFRNYEIWAKEIKELAGDRKVAFYNSFQYPSKYAFYSGGEFSNAFNSLNYRRNQYDIWDFEQEMQGENIILFKGPGSTDTLKSVVGDFLYRNIDNFHSYFDIKIHTKESEICAQPADTISMEIEIENPRKSSIVFESSDPQLKPRICCVFYSGKKVAANIYGEYLSDTLQAGEVVGKNISFPVPSEPGEYSLNISIVNDMLWAPFNSKPIKVIIAPKNSN